MEGFLGDFFEAKSKDISDCTQQYQIVRSLCNIRRLLVLTNRSSPSKAKKST